MNKVTAIIVLPYDSTEITIWRGEGKTKTYTKFKDVSRIMEYLNWKSKNYEIRVIHSLQGAGIGAHHINKIIYIPIKKGHRASDLSHKLDNYRELLRYAWDFVNDNIDGRLEDWEAADRLWDILGAEMARTKEDREFHINELVRQYGKIWRSLYEDK